MIEVDIQSMTMAQQRQLVQEVLDGRVDAFGKIVLDTQKLVTQIVFKMIDDHADRKDLSQDIYLKVYQNLAEYRHEAKLTTWIAQIAYNHCMSHLRKRRIRIVELEPQDCHDHYPDESRQIEMMSQKDWKILLKSEIDRLSPVYRTVLTLFHLQELSYKEIMIITGLPEGTLKSYLNRARSQLRSRLLVTFKKDKQ